MKENMSAQRYPFCWLSQQCWGYSSSSKLWATVSMILSGRYARYALLTRGTNLIQGQNYFQLWKKIGMRYGTQHSALSHKPSPRQHCPLCSLSPSALAPSSWPRVHSSRFSFRSSAASFSSASKVFVWFCQRPIAKGQKPFLPALFPYFSITYNKIAVLT